MPRHTRPCFLSRVRAMGGRCPKSLRLLGKVLKRLFNPNPPSVPGVPRWHTGNKLAQVWRRSQGRAKSAMEAKANGLIASANLGDPLRKLGGRSGQPKRPPLKSRNLLRSLRGLRATATCSPASLLEGRRDQAEVCPGGRSRRLARGG